MRAEESWYFHRAVTLSRAMFPGVFLYFLFAVATEAFDWNIFIYTAKDTVTSTGYVLTFFAVLTFPAARVIERLMSRGTPGGDALFKKLYYATLINLGIGEIHSVFGIVLYVMSGDVRYFFLFFNLGLLHIIVSSPREKRWDAYTEDINK
ncbi:hypothetical protein [Limisalsivibrio acetivorans]|uniref:hypothetical protein n=1 Tax=Limisalsivibrio acetivorans TaxID=1304888 RepID=UPI0003B4047E|nr:hypothetical protein [Limisalsivibrio acetivorans]